MVEKKNLYTHTRVHIYHNVYMLVSTGINILQYKSFGKQGAPRAPALTSIHSEFHKATPIHKPLSSLEHSIFP